MTTRVPDLPPPVARPVGVAGVGAIVCPACGVTTSVAIPTHACLFFFDCPGCSTLVQPADGDCCVFCSYGDRPCPARGCCT